MREISVEVPTTEETLDGTANVTGMSCGIDSFTTLIEYTDECEDDDYRLTHLLYFKVGAHDGQINRFDGEVEDRLYRAQLEHVRGFCGRYGYELVEMDSNLNQVLSEAFGFEWFEHHETYRNAGAVLLLQGLVHRYYYASTYGMDTFAIDLHNGVSHYSKWLLPNLETEGCVLYEANGALNRVEKTAKVADYAPSYDSLLVCWTGLGENCGRCPKCVRTLATLDVLGKVDLYAGSFDLDDWHAHREERLADVVNKHNRDLYFKDIYQYMRSNNIPLPSPGARLENYWTRGWRKLRKVTRGKAQPDSDPGVTMGAPE